MLTEDVCKNVFSTPLSCSCFSPCNTCHLLIYHVIYIFVVPVTYCLCSWENISSTGQDLCFVHWCSPGTVHMPGIGPCSSAVPCGWVSSSTGQWAQEEVSLRGFICGRAGAAATQVHIAGLEGSVPQTQVSFSRKTLCPGTEGAQRLQVWAPEYLRRLPESFNVQVTYLCCKDIFRNNNFSFPFYWYNKSKIFKYT